MDIDVDTFLTTVYYVVDDLYRAHYARYKPRRRGHRPELSDSEVLTLAVLAAWQRDRSERAFLAYVAAHWPRYFPRLLDQSAFNRRVHDLCGVLCALGPAMARQIARLLPPSAYQVADGVPVPLMRRCRGARHRTFATEAGLGCGGSDKDLYYGVELLVRCDQHGLITGFVIAPASTDERWQLEALLRWQCDPSASAPTAAEADGFLGASHKRGGGRVGPTGPLGPRLGVGQPSAAPLLTDLGFGGAAWQQHWRVTYDATVLTKAVYPQRADRSWFCRLRQCIESVNGLLDQLLGLKFPRARTRTGLYCRLAAKIIAYNLILHHNLLTARPRFSPLNPLIA